MKRFKKKIITLATLFAVFGTFAVMYYGINSHVFQKAVIGIVNRGSLEFNFSELKFKIFSNKIYIKDFDFTNEETGQRLHANSINIKYNPFVFLQGRLVLAKLDIEGFDGVFPKTSAKEKTSKISIKKLFILKNLVIEKGTIQNAELTFANSTLITDTLLFEFKPKLTGDIELAINLHGINYKTEDQNISAGSLNIEGQTKPTDWSDIPPYVNSIHGKISLKDFASDKFNIAGLSAKIDVEDNRFKLSDLEIIKDGKKLAGTFDVDLDSEKYKTEIKAKDPIPFPMLGEENPLIDTSGFVFGELIAIGTGLTPEKSEGSAKLNLTHTKEPLAPITLESSPSWKKGVVTLGKTKVIIKDGVVDVKGTVNIPGKKFDIACEGKNLPLESIFGRFGDENFHPVFGTADGKAVITGWAKDFKVVGEGYTTGESGYYKITSERAHIKVDATYQELNLNGEIEQDGKKAGDVSLKIKYGAKVKGQPRPKNLHIEANAYNNDLGKTFKEYNLTGIGNARMVLDGPQRSFTSKINAAIVEGSFAGISFQKASADADMEFKKIKLTNGEFIIPNMRPVQFSSPIQLDFETGGFHMYGKPIEGVAFDTNYKSANLLWNIKNLTYHNLTLNGIYTPKGLNDLNINGTIEGANLSVFKQYLRDAEGPIYAKLKITGTAANPAINGKILFNENKIYPRMLNKRLEKVTGSLFFEGHTIKTDSLTGNIDDGPFTAKGYIQHENSAPQKFDINFTCDDLRYVNPERTLKLEFAANVNWSGSKSLSLIKGDATILDGRYTKDFIILEELAIGQKSEKKSEKLGDETTRLDLRIRNTGDFRIKNNVGDIWLKTDILAKGTAARPLISGTVEAPEGKIHYLGREFVITKGFIEFKDQYTNPYLEITAEHEVPNISDLVITVALHGRTDNLALDLSSTKPMEKRDIVSMLLFGVTEQEMRDTQYSAGFGQSMAASQISHMLERPITKIAHLDTFRVESGTSQTGAVTPSNLSISKIYMGKQVSDRLIFEFFTDVNSQDSQQNVRANYLLTDFLVLKGESSTGQQYKFNLSLRFKER